MADQTENGPSVLVVDDKVKAIRGFRIALHNSEYQISGANDPESAMDIVRSDVQLVAAFVDQQFGSDARAGLDVIRKITKERPFLPTMLYTTQADEDIKREAYDAGALWYVPKENADAEGLKDILRVAVKLFHQMPIDTDPRFLKKMLDAVPIEIMVRDKAGRVYWQNMRKTTLFDSIIPGSTHCWAAYEGREDLPTAECEFVETECAVWPIFQAQVQKDQNRIQETLENGKHSPVERIHTFKGHGKQPPGHLYLAAGAIVGQNGEAEYAVETARDITAQIELLQLTTELQKSHGLNEKEVLKRGVNTVIEKLRFRRARAYLTDARQQNFDCVYAKGNYNRDASRLIGQTVKWNSEFIQAKLKDKKASQVTLDEVMEHAESTQEFIEAIGRAEVSLWAPIFIGDCMIAVIVADRKGDERETVSPLDETWLNYLCQNVSAAIERKRIMDDSKWLRNLDRALSGAESSEHAVEITTRMVSDRVRADVVQVHQKRIHQGQESIVVRGIGHSDNCEMSRGYDVELGVNSKVIRTGKAVFKKNVRQDADYRQFRQRFDESECPACNRRLSSLASIPIHKGEKTIASLCVGYETQFPFSLADQELLKSASESLSVALKTMDRVSISQTIASEIRKSQRLQLLSRALGHALRNQTNVITTKKDSIKNSTPDVAVTKACDVIQGEVRKITEQLNALDEIAFRSDEIVNVHALIKAFIGLNSSLFNDKKIEIQLSLPTELNVGWQSRAELLFALDTAINNSFKKMEDVGGLLTISTSAETDGERMRIVIKDNAGGVDSAILPRIFDWPQAELSGKPQIHGIGLPMSRQLLRDMGGDMMIENEGDGAVVTIEIPVQRYGNE